MRWFRTITCFVRVLVALFVLAQFAGVVSSPLADTLSIPAAAASHVHHHHHANNQDRGGGDPGENHGDHCCALHAFFVGVLPPAVAVETVSVISQRLTADLADASYGVVPGLLDRPPRPFAVI